MGIASEMKELTRDIAPSHRARTRRLGEIRRETKQARGEAHHLIEGFHASRKRKAAEIRRDLARGEAERKSDSKKMLRGFQSSRREEGSHMREDLSRDRAARKSGVTGMLGGSRNARREEGAQMREDLSQNRAARKSGVTEMLGGSRNARREEGSQLRKELAQGLAEQRSELRKMRGDIQKAQAEVRADLKEARAVWQGLAGAIQVSKGRAETPLVAPAPAAEKRNSDLEIKMLAAVREHPEGMTLAGMSGSLGVAAVVLGRLSKSLMKKGMIRKVEKLYFPANGGSEAKEGLHFRPPLR